MKRVLYVVPVLALSATVVFSQMPAGQKVGLATSIQRGYAGLKQNLTQEADKMPEADYSWKPGTTPDVRPFSAVIAHIVQAQFGQCSAIKGVPNPMQGKNLEQELKAKADVTKALADSFAMCDDVFAQTTDENATQFIKVGPNEVTRAAALFGFIAHGNEIYGTGAVYLRSKNIVPPSTERAMQGRGRGN
jgi:uncharacterized damage-inducible protein DinB